MKNYSGILGSIKKAGTILLAMVLLYVLRDDDIKAIPHMRFQIANPSVDDKSVLDLVSRINELKISEWTKDRIHHE